MKCGIMEDMYDILIKNGEVVDGSGKAKYKADVAVADGRIAKIGALGSARAEITLEVDGLAVAPGFIDVLSHSDAYLTLFTAPGQESSVSQGVTTIIGGNCGYSLAPLAFPGTLIAEQRWTDNPAQINVDWLKMGEFLECLKNKKIAVNFGTLAGYNTIARGLLEHSHRPLNQYESEIALFLVEQALDEGALGVSLGLAYLAQNGHGAERLGAVFEKVKSRGKVITAHLGDEWSNFLDSLNFVLKLAEEHKTVMHISHLKVFHEKYWPNFRRAIMLIEKAQKNGAKISFDIFPYASSSLPLYLLLPDWAKKSGPDLIIKRLKNNFERKKIVKDLVKRELDFSKMTVASLAPDLYIGKTVVEVAKDFGLSGEETICELLLASRLRAVVFAHLLDETALEMAVAHPLSLIGSSGAGYSLTQTPAADRNLPHPRSFGSFPRFFRKYAREKKLLALEEAVAKVTARPAKLFGIKNRGLLKEGHFADIVVFDPVGIVDKATFQNPFQYSEGVTNVIVNGALVYDRGYFIKNFPGRCLTSAR